jgi:hypothetical protein
MSGPAKYTRSTRVVKDSQSENSTHPESVGPSQHSQFNHKAMGQPTFRIFLGACVCLFCITIGALAFSGDIEHSSTVLEAFKGLMLGVMGIILLLIVFLRILWHEVVGLVSDANRSQPKGKKRGS